MTKVPRLSSLAVAQIAHFRTTHGLCPSRPSGARGVKTMVK
jgi:hypothetical protein